MATRFLYDRLNGVLNVTKVGVPERLVVSKTGDLPTNFDWREKAGDTCPSLNEIQKMMKTQKFLIL